VWNATHSAFDANISSPQQEQWTVTVKLKSATPQTSKVKLFTAYKAFCPLADKPA